MAVECQSKNITWNRSMACWDPIGLLSLPIQAECMNSLRINSFRWLYNRLPNQFLATESEFIVYYEIYSSTVNKFSRPTVVQRN